jgi:hypothetical protein
MGTDVSDAIKTLREKYHLAHVDGAVDARLGSLAQALASLDTSPTRREALGTDGERWQGLDLWRAFDLERIEERAAQHYEKHERHVNWLEWARNVLILLPVAITWLSLSLATASYADLLRRQPRLSLQPFLLLWQQGFGESAPKGWLTFSNVALGDFVLLLGVVALTVRVQHHFGVAQQDARNRAADLRRELDHVLWQANCLLEPLRQSAMEQCTREMVTRIENVATHSNSKMQEFTDRARDLIAEIETLARERQDEIGSLKQFARDLKSGTAAFDRAAKHLVSAADKGNDIHQDLAAAVRGVESQVAGHNGYQGKLQTQMDLLRAHFDTLAATEAVLAQNIEEAASTLATSTTRCDAQVARLSDALTGLEGTTTGIGTTFAQMLTPIEGVISGMAAAAAGLEGTRSTQERLLSAALERQGRMLDAQGRTLNDLLTTTLHSHGAVAGDLQTAARAAQGAADGLTNTVTPLREMSISLGNTSTSLATASKHTEGYEKSLRAAMEDQKRIVAALSNSTSEVARLLGEVQKAQGDNARANQVFLSALSTLSRQLEDLQGQVALESSRLVTPQAFTDAFTAAWRHVQGDWIGASRTAASGGTERRGVLSRLFGS